MINVKIEEFFIASWKQIGLIVSDMEEHPFLWFLFVIILGFIISQIQSIIRGSFSEDINKRRTNNEDLLEKFKELNSGFKELNSGLKIGLKDLNNNIESKIDLSNGILSSIDKTVADIHLINNITFFMNADKNSVIEKVRRDGSSLRYASKEMRADKEVVMAAVSNYGVALGLASEELKADKEVVMKAVTNSRALCYASEEMRADKDIVMAAVLNDSYELQYASEILKADKELVMVAVRRQGMSLYYSSEEMRADKEVVLKAVGSDGRALKDASKSLRADKEVVRAALKDNRHEDIRFIDYIAYELFDDIDILRGILKRDYRDLTYSTLPKKLREKLKNKFLFLDLVKRDGYKLRFASDDLRKDKEVVFEALKNCIQAFEFVSSDLNTVTYTIELIDAGIKVGDENYQFKHGKDIVLKYEELKQKNSWLSPIYRSYILWKYK